jgi:hypothetical protein
MKRLSLLALVLMVASGCVDEGSESVSSSLIPVVEDNAPTSGFDFPIEPGELAGQT